MGLPFEPEPEITLKARFPEALRKVYNAQNVLDDPDTRASARREHVFDFFDGMRLIVSRDTDGQRTFLHASASMTEAGAAMLSDVKEFVGLMITHLVELRGEPLQGQAFLKQKGPAVHLLYEEGQGSGNCGHGLSCPFQFGRGDPNLN